MNEDEDFSICLITEEVVMLDEAHKIKCRVFINRYLKYFIDEEGNMRANLFDYRSRITNIVNK